MTDESIECRIGVLAKENARSYVRSLAFPPDMTFEAIVGASFTNRMVMATIGMGADHCCYVLIPEAVAQEEPLPLLA